MEERNRRFVKVAGCSSGACVEGMFARRNLGTSKPCRSDTSASSACFQFITNFNRGCGSLSADEEDTDSEQDSEDSRGNEKKLVDRYVHAHSHHCASKRHAITIVDPQVGRTAGQLHAECNSLCSRTCTGLLGLCTATRPSGSPRNACPPDPPLADAREGRDGCAYGARAARNWSVSLPIGSSLPCMYPPRLSN